MHRRPRVSFKKQLLCTTLAGLVCALPTAVWAGTPQPYSIFLAGAYPFSLGATHQWVSGEYGITGGFNVDPTDWPVGLQFDGMNYRFGFNDHAVQFSGSDGYAQITAGTANVTWKPHAFREATFEPRLISGIGVYNRVVRTTEQRPLQGTCFDPWWGYVPCTETGNVITNSSSQTKLGFNVGVSFGYEMARTGEFFVEVRYHHVLTSHKDTQFMPVNIGFRW